MHLNILPLLITQISLTVTPVLSLKTRCSDVQVNNCTEEKLKIFRSWPYWHLAASYVNQCLQNKDYLSGHEFPKMCPEIYVKRRNATFLITNTFYENPTKILHYQNLFVEEDSCIFENTRIYEETSCSVGLKEKRWKTKANFWSSWAILGTDYKDWIALWYCKMDPHRSDSSTQILIVYIRSSLSLEKKYTLREDIFNYLSSIGIETKYLYKYDLEMCERIRQTCSGNGTKKQGYILLLHAFIFIILST